MEFKKRINYDINIKASQNNGFIVSVGCCSLVYTDSTQLLGDLRNFFNNPEEVEEKYNNRCKTSTHLCEPLGGNVRAETCER